MDSTTWLSIGARPFFDWWIVGSMNGFVVFCKCNGEEYEMTSEKCGIWSQVLDFRIVWRWCFVSSKTDSRPKRITWFFFGVKEKRLIFCQTWLPSSRQWNFNQTSGQGNGGNEGNSTSPAILLASQTSLKPSDLKPWLPKHGIKSWFRLWGPRPGRKPFFLGFLLGGFCWSIGVGFGLDFAKFWWKDKSINGVNKIMMRLETTVGEKSHIVTLLFAAGLFYYPFLSWRKTIFPLLEGRSFPPAEAQVPQQACFNRNLDIKLQNLARFPRRKVSSKPKIPIHGWCGRELLVLLKLFGKMLGGSFWGSLLGWWSNKTWFDMKQVRPKSLPFFKRCKRKNFESQAKVSLFYIGNWPTHFRE